MIDNTTYRTRFIQNALRPFLQILRPFRNQVYAIDLMNEPEGFSFWTFVLPIGLLTPSRPYPRVIRIPTNQLIRSAHAYIREASDEIRANFREFKVSTGFRAKSTIEAHLSSLDSKLDFFDFHHYDTNSLDEKSFS